MEPAPKRTYNVATHVFTYQGQQYELGLTDIAALLKCNYTNLSMKISDGYTVQLIVDERALRAQIADIKQQSIVRQGKGLCHGEPE